MTAEELAKSFHEAYRRVSPKFYGTTATSPSWDEIDERSREHLIAVCGEVLGEPFEAPSQEEVAEVEKVPTSEDFEEAKRTAPDEQGEDALSDWEAELKRQIDSVTATSIRRAFEDVKEPFRK
jgi:hypothetical protein